MPYTNPQIAAVFQQMADVLEILGGDRFRVNAYRRAARIVDDLPQDLAALGPNVKQLAAIEGIGKGTAQRIAQFLTTGKIEEHEELLTKIPKGLTGLLAVPGLGPKTIALLWKHAGIESLEDLKTKLKDDRLAQLPGLGSKKLENLRQSIAFASVSVARIRIGQALPLALWFVNQLRELPHVQQAAYAGSLRRGRETIGDIDLIVASPLASGTPPKATNPTQAISDAFVGLEPVNQVLAQGPTKTSVRAGDTLSGDQRGVQVDLRIVGPENFGAAWLYFTGSKEHNVALRERAIQQGLKLNEYGLFKGNHCLAGETEDQIYQQLGLAWIPPALREDRGELVLAQDNKLPKLIELANIKAELHAHTTASDGRWSVYELAMAAAERGYHTIAITDHSKSQAIANGLSNKRLEQHIEHIKHVAQQLKNTISVLAGSEVDILADGSLDYPNSLLKQLDVVVASPHSALNQDPEKATKRLLRAIENPYVTIIGHPTGRLINRRRGLRPNFAQLYPAATARGIALEINANSWRLDLNDTHARAAIDAGAMLAINTDAHGPGDMDQLIYGLFTARRAGATPKQVVNCLSKTALAKWIKSTKF